MNLEQILETKFEPEIISFFLLAPPRSFYIDELVARLSIPKAKMIPLLDKMVHSGHMKTFSKKGKKYYMIRADYKPLPEFKQALVKSKLVYTDELYAAVPKIGTIKACFLSGLFVGQITLPVDILIVGKVQESKFQEFIKNLERMMGQEINYSVMDEEEFVTRRNTFDRFIKDIFDYPHLAVIDYTPRKRSKK